MRGRIVAAIVVLISMSVPAAASDVSLHAAGSLRGALTGVVKAFSQYSVALPDTLSVGAEYGMTVIKGASENAGRLAQFILSADGQNILAKHGFAPPN